MPGHSHIRESPWYFPLQTLLLAEFLQQPRLNSTRQKHFRNRLGRKNQRKEKEFQSLRSRDGTWGWVGGFRLDQERALHPEGAWALNSLPREVGTAPSLTELEKYLDNALRHGWEHWSVGGQELDWMILVGPFQLHEAILCEIKITIYLYPHTSTY